MNAYDFDETILHHNSYRAFYFFCLVRFPWLLVFFFYNMFFVIASALHLCSKDVMLRECGRFVALVPNRQKQITKFWDGNMKNIAKWYLAQKRDDDVIISASPYYEVSEACHRLGVKCFASDVNVKNGNLTEGHFLYKEEKAKVWKREYGEVIPDEFYTDSPSDLPMLLLAKKGYYVNLKKGTITLAYENGKEVDGPITCFNK